MNRACRRIQISAKHSNYPIQRLERPRPNFRDYYERRWGMHFVLYYPLNKAGIVVGADKKFHEIPGARALSRWKSSLFVFEVRFIKRATYVFMHLHTTLNTHKHILRSEEEDNLHKWHISRAQFRVYTHDNYKSCAFIL